jgi:hypothetical protein
MRMSASLHQLWCAFLTIPLLLSAHAQELHASSSNGVAATAGDVGPTGNSALREEEGRDSTLARFGKLPAVPVEQLAGVRSSTSIDHHLCCEGRSPFLPVTQACLSAKERKASDAAPDEDKRPR